VDTFNSRQFIPNWGRTSEYVTVSARSERATKILGLTPAGPPTKMRPNETSKAAALCHPIYFFPAVCAPGCVTRFHIINPQLRIPPRPPLPQHTSNELVPLSQPFNRVAETAPSHTSPSPHRKFTESQHLKRPPSNIIIPGRAEYRDLRRENREVYHLIFSVCPDPTDRHALLRNSRRAMCIA